MVYHSHTLAVLGLPNSENTVPEINTKPILMLRLILLHIVVWSFEVQRSTKSISCEDTALP